MANTLYPAFALTTLWALLPRTPAAPAPWLASLTHSRPSLLVMLLRKSSSALKEGLGVCAQCCCDTHYTHCHLTSTCFAIAHLRVYLLVLAELGGLAQSFICS